MSTRIKRFQNKIWDFYKDNKRNFPWRTTSNYYHILISEIMLQQTQANRVVPKYDSFIKRFPTINKLSQASNTDVLRLWIGLGYNRRALYLKNAALHLLQNPELSYENLIKIKGIGKNTAGAIYVFSTNKPHVFIETNIRRVYIHEFFSKDNNISDKKLLEKIEKTLDQDNPRDWYYALMDYGAYLSKAIANPNRKSAHYVKQSTFEGSTRQIRGNIIKLVLTVEKISLPELKKKINSIYFDKALKQLEKEKFLSVSENIITAS